MSSLLIIEDDTALLHSMALVLSMEGFSCRTALNGQDGLAQIREQQPDLILCDIMMEGMSGHDFLAVMKGTPETTAIPFIFVTALEGRSEQRRGMTAGADDYLTKPFTNEELIAAVIGRLHHAETVRMAHVTIKYADELQFLRQNISARELEILLLVGRGLTSKEIAEQLGISFKTAQVHRANLMKKLNALNAAHLARWAVIAEFLK